MTEYVLEAHIPYGRSEILFEGSEEGLREFCKQWLTFGSKSVLRDFPNVPKIQGFYLDDLTVSIVGPDIREFLP